MRRGGRACRPVRARKLGGPAKAVRDRGDVWGSTRTPAAGMTNSGGPPTTVATTERSEAIASSSACPNGSTRLGWQTTSAAWIQRRTSSCGTRPASVTRGLPSSCGAKRAVADEREPRPFQSLERLCEADDVLPLVERADAQISGAVAVPAERGARLGLVAAAKALEVDAAVDDLDLAERARDARLELAAQVVRDGDDGVRAADDGLGGRLDAADRADVADVAAVGGDDEWGARGEVGEQAGGDEVVGVDDVGLRPAGDGAGRRKSRRYLARPPPRLVSTARSSSWPRRAQRLDERDEERAVVGIVRPRPHLRDEEDPHAREL